LISSFQTDSLVTDLILALVPGGSTIPGDSLPAIHRHPRRAQSMIHRKPSLTSIAILSCLAVPAAPVMAALYDRGSGLIYDDILNVTWMQDAAYHVTSNAPNVDANGKVPCRSGSCAMVTWPTSRSSSASCSGW
jgi:hypothetical protein